MENIIIYDKRKYFYRYVKNRYKKEYNFIKHIHLSESNQDNINDLFLIIFVAYESCDVIAFLNYYGLSHKIIVCSHDSAILNKYKKINNIHLLNINTIKNNISLQLDSELETYKTA